MADELSLGSTSVEEILARMVADTTAGIDPASPAYPDVVAGAILNDVFGATALEADRIYDRVYNELPNAALPNRTFGKWLDAWADVLGLGRKDEVAASAVVTFVAGAGAAPVIIPTGTIVSTEAPAEDAEEIEFQTTADATLPVGGTVDVAVVAVEPGVEGNVPANSLTVLETGVSNVAAVSNVLPAQGGADVESDEFLQGRVERKLRGGGGPGNVTDYENWALEEPGVGFVTVESNWAGLGTVRVIVTSPTNDPVAAAVLDSLQQRLDPLDGTPGQAPIGATVTVTTPAVQAITVTAGVTPEAGYSLAGAGGTRPLAAAIEASLRRYIDALPPGDDVVKVKVIAAIADVEGVANTNVTAPAGDVAVGALQVASLTTLTLT